MCVGGGRQFVLFLNRQLLFRIKSLILHVCVFKCFSHTKIEMNVDFQIPVWILCCAYFSAASCVLGLSSTVHTGLIVIRDLRTSSCDPLISEAPRSPASGAGGTPLLPWCPWVGCEHRGPGCPSDFCRRVGGGRETLILCERPPESPAAMEILGGCPSQRPGFGTSVYLGAAPLSLSTLCPDCVLRCSPTTQCQQDCACTGHRERFAFFLQLSGRTPTRSTPTHSRAAPRVSLCSHRPCVQTRPCLPSCYSVALRKFAIVSGQGRAVLPCPGASGCVSSPAPSRTVGSVTCLCSVSKAHSSTH